MHSGNYTCAPSNAKKTSIMVHVVDGKYIFIFKVVQSQQDIIKLRFWIQTNKKDFYVIWNKGKQILNVHLL